jgi:outer membrane lipoprotein-sorting protein
MKKWILYAYLVVWLSHPSLGQELTGQDIVQRVNDLMNQESSRAVMTMTITTTSGQKRTFEYEAFSKDRGEKTLMIYTSPMRLKGQKMLMLNNADDIWAYFARTRRVRKLASHAKRQKLEGSDFSYEDMGSGNSFLTDFKATKLGDEKKEGYDCYSIQLDKLPSSGSAYSKMVMWVRKDDFLPVVIDYYDEDDPEVVAKQLVQSDIQDIQGVPTAMKLTMTNRNDNSETVLELKEISYNVDLDDELFTERGLQK